MVEALTQPARAASAKAGPVIGTIATRSHYALALTLAESFLRHHPNGQVHVLSVDGPAPMGLFPPRVKVWDALALGWPELPAMHARYSAFELCNSLKPFLLQHLLAVTNSAKLCYFDADIYFFGNIEAEIWHALDTCDLMLTPHLCHTPDISDPDLLWRDAAILQHGVFNGGFVGVRRSATADEFLHWWRQRLITGGHKNLAEGFNCDQRWLDLLPGFYGTALSVNRHAGLNVAYWNLCERRIETAADGSLTVSGQPLKFWHFSGYDSQQPHLITKHWTPFNFANRPDVKPLFDIYQRSLAACRGQLADYEGTGPVSTQSGSDGPVANGPSLPLWVLTGTPKEPDSKNLVSVIIPAHNATRWISEAVASVFAQTYEPLEVIIIDDGSEDDLATALAEWRERVTLVRQTQQGVSVARNHGAALARGEFVTFLDADDYFLQTDALAAQVALLQAHPKHAWAQSGWRLVTDNGATLAERRPWNIAPEINLISWLQHQPALPSATLYRRAALLDVGGFDASLTQLEDVEIALRLLLAGYGASWHKQISMAYRQHAAQASQKVAKQARAVMRLWDGFFSRSDLPSMARHMEREVRHNAAVWLAYRAGRAGQSEIMSEALRKACAYSDLPQGACGWAGLAQFQQMSQAEGVTLPECAAQLAIAAADSRQQTVGSRQQESRLQTDSRQTDSRQTADSRQQTADSSGEQAVGGKQQAAGSRQPESRQQTAANDVYLALSPQPSALNLATALAADYGRHRAGWSFVLNSLRVWHDDAGLVVDGFCEHTFDPTGGTVAPQGKAWLGFLHNPPNAPRWFGQSPEQLLASEAFQASLPNCAALICTSDYLRRWWAGRVSVPVHSILHPTEFPTVQFSWARFLANPSKKIVQIGSWLRKLYAIYDLQVTRLQRAIVHQHRAYIKDWQEAEKVAYGLRPATDAVTVLPFLDNAAYDKLLAANIVFLELYDSSANNAILECLARATPILVNPSPAVREYLGDAYPLYYTSRRQAARLAEDLDALRAAHEYLQNLALRERVSVRTFQQNLAYITRNAEARTQ